MHERAVNYPDDLDGLDGLFEQCRLADHHAPIGEHKYLGLMAGGPDRTIARVFEDGNELIGYMHLTRRVNDETWVLEVALHPDHREPGTIREVIESAVALGFESGGTSIRVWAYHPAVAAIVEELGFLEERKLLQLRVPLPPGLEAAVPPGFRLTAFRVGIDEDTWIEVNNRAFLGHPENGSWNRAILADRFRQDWFDPDGLLMAWQDGEPAGFCWTKQHTESLGEIYVVAVDPEYQRRSLGRWLTLEGLWYLSQRRAASVAMLYVDSENLGAVAMYEGLGFVQDHVDRSYVRPIGVRQPGTGEPNTRAHDGQA